MTPHRTMVTTLLALLIWTVSSLAQTDTAPCRKAAPDQPLRVDFRDAPLRDVIRFVSCTTELNVILSPPTLSSHRVTMVAPRTVTARDLFPLLRAALRHAGLVATDRGAYLLIRPDPAHVPSKRRSNKGR